MVELLRKVSNAHGILRQMFVADAQAEWHYLANSYRVPIKETSELAKGIGPVQHESSTTLCEAPALSCHGMLIDYRSLARGSVLPEYGHEDVRT